MPKGMFSKGKYKRSIHDWRPQPEYHPKPLPEDYEPPRCADTGEIIEYVWVELEDGTRLSVEAFQNRYPQFHPENRFRKGQMKLPLD